MSYDDDLVSRIRLQAVDETGDVMRGMSQRIEETTSAFKKLTGAFVGGEFVRSSFTGFAELTRTFERLQFATKATEKDMSSLGEIFDDVGKRTGRSTDEVAKAFQNFYIATGQQFGPALEKMFKTIGETSAITGASLESLSRIAGAAVNNMKVPQEQMDNLIKKLAVDLPGSLETFAQMAPRVTESLSAIGLTGSKNVEEAGLAFNALNIAFGNARLSASAMNNVLTQLYDGSTIFGKMMIPTLMEIRKNGGDVTETLEAMYQKLNAMHAFDPNTPPAMLKVLGLDFNTMKAIKIWHESLDITRQKLKENEEAAKEFGNRLSKVTKDPLEAINKLSAGFENLKNSFGAFMVSLGASQALTKFSDQLDSISRLIDDINRGEWKKALQEATRPIGGPIPGKEEEKEHPASKYVPWRQGTALSRPITKALRGMMGGGGSGEIDEPSAFNERASTTPKMARGGIVNKPTIAEIGEAGPEEVVPLTGENGSSTKDNTNATKENTDAINRMSAYMHDTSGRRGIYMNAAYTPGAGESPLAAEAQLYGDRRFGTASSGGSRGDDRSGPNGQIPRTMQSSPDQGGPRVPQFGRRGGGGQRPTGGQQAVEPGKGMTDYSPMNVPGSDPALAADRSKRFDAEFANDPQLAEDMAQISLGENQNPAANQAVLETIFNRASARGTSLRTQMQEYTGKGSKGYYPPSTFSGGAAAMRNSKLHAMATEHLRRARGGGNVSNYATDNSSQGLAYTERYGGASGNYGRPGQPPGKFTFQSEFGGSGGTGSSGMETYFSPGWGGGQDQYMKWRNQLDKNRGAADHSEEAADGTSFKDRWGDSGSGSVFDKGTSGVPHLDQHRAMRKEMERPIKMSVEAPTPPPMYSYRQRMARQQSRYQSDDMLGAPRYASQLDIGFA